MYEAEKNYYSLQFDLKTNSVKQIWHNLNSAVSMSKIKNKVNIPKLTVNDSEVTNTKESCNILNNYFCSIGPTLGQKINCGISDYLQYCSPSIKDSMYCNPVQAEEIIKIVSQFKANKSPGVNNIGPKLLKLYCMTYFNL